MSEPPREPKADAGRAEIYDRPKRRRSPVSAVILVALLAVAIIGGLIYYFVGLAEDDDVTALPAPLTATSLLLERIDSVGVEAVSVNLWL